MKNTHKKYQKNSKKKQNLEFWKYFRSLKMNDKEIEERKRRLNGDCD